ncbi:MAG: YicC family protein [Oscillospiraceae bacterium]|nr:YicC family protein [Oscillospiraceae bacterium]
MIRSMTGYGRCQRVVEGRDITVELKSVNHRYFEFSARVPRAHGYLEDKLKRFVQKSLSRGKTDIYVGIVALEDETTNVQINTGLARSYLKAIRGLAEELDLTDDITVSRLARFSDIFAVQRLPEDETAVWEAVSGVAAEALSNMIEMRETEGEKLKQDILMRLGLIEGFTETVEKRSPEVADEHREKLYARISEILENRQIDDARILTEAAIFAEKTAVDEETVRLKSHIGQLRQLLSGREPVGRKLDFLVQELNREANTIGSKAHDIEIARIVVDMKSEIEKIREQIQNIE